MSDDIEHWKRMAANAGIQRDGRTLKRERIVRALDWADWSQEEREIYASAFLFPSPLEPLIDNITISGEVLNMKRLLRTARVVDETGTVWLVVEHCRPEKAR